MASLADETPEGRSIVVLAKEKYGIRSPTWRKLNATFIPFTGRPHEGVDAGASSVRKGGRCDPHYVGAVRATMASAIPCGALQPSIIPDVARKFVRSRTKSPRPAAPAGRCKDGRLLGVVQLKDIVKGHP